MTITTLIPYRTPGIVSELSRQLGPLRRPCRVRPAAETARTGRLQGGMDPQGPDTPEPSGFPQFLWIRITACLMGPWDSQNNKSAVFPPWVAPHVLHCPHCGAKSRQWLSA